VDPDVVPDAGVAVAPAIGDDVAPDLSDALVVGVAVEALPALGDLCALEKDGVRGPYRLMYALVRSL